ncbi:MAG: hypothetical protein NVS9B3_04670 [Gemmatimonadaceae bacterium]
MRTVHIVIGCDTDPDRPGFLAGAGTGALAWRGMTEGIPALKRSLHGVRDANGREPIVTWLLRADDQIRQLHGSYASIVRTHRSFLRILEESGDELGWHPHFWRREDNTGSAWYQEVEDIDWQVTMLREAYADLASSVAGPIASVRMGWDYHNNHTVGALEELGVTVDFSALPGLRSFTGAPPTRRDNLFDWHTSPRHPFRPSRVDYRRPARESERSYALLEVPNFVSTSPLWGWFGGLQLARKARDPALLAQAFRHPTYWINLTARPRLFAPLVHALRTSLRRDENEARPLVFATYFHPDELLPNRSRVYDLGSVRTNVESLIRTCDESGAAVRFAKASDLPGLFAPLS